MDAASAESDDGWGLLSAGGKGWSLPDEHERPAPLLHTSCAQPASTWFGAGGAQACQSKPCWRPLGQAWRQRDQEADEGRCVRRVGESREFARSCIPNWSKEAKIRTKGLIEHELTWAYYRMRRHEQHPQRKAVGEYLQKEGLPEEMRFGRHAMFQFWRDLRPPFSVLEFKRIDHGTAEQLQAEAADEVASQGEAEVGDGQHPDGELYSVTYECPIEYVAERLMDDKKGASTFDNKVKGVAKVRIPNSFPQQRRCIHIKSWGQPTLNPPEDWDLAAGRPRRSERKAAVPPPVGAPPPESALGAWEARELKKAGTVRMDLKKKWVKVTPLEGLKLGKHASLPRLEKQDGPGQLARGLSRGLSRSLSRSFTRSVTGLGGAAAGPEATAAPQDRHGDEEPTRTRKHRIWTAAVGFVTYDG